MKELIKAIRIVKSNLEKNNVLIKNCEGNPFYGDIRLTLTHGKIDFTRASDDKNGILETIKI